MSRRTSPDGLLPKLLTAVRDFDRRQFLAGLSSEVVAGVVALPLAFGDAPARAREHL